MPNPFFYEADVVEGIEPIAQAELLHVLGKPAKPVAPGVLQLDVAHGDPKKQTPNLASTTRLHTVLSVYTVQNFAVPRPKALLGDQFLRALLQQVAAVIKTNPTLFRTLMLAAAGAHSPTMQRLRQEIAQRFNLRVVEEDADLLVRLRPAIANAGWQALVRTTSKPLATRDWRVCGMAGALGATVAHAMALLSVPTPTDRVLNLCCGSGTLLIERAKAGAAQRLFGCDVNPQALACAQKNVASYRKKPIELFDWDACQLPLPNASVDVLLADLPFGVLVGSHKDNARLYPAMLNEAARVAKPNARFVVITQELRLMDELIRQSNDWLVRQTLRVNLNGLRPQIYVLQRAA